MILFPSRYAEFISLADLKISARYWSLGDRRWAKSERIVVAWN